jgi:hypothetical protein
MRSLEPPISQFKVMSPTAIPIAVVGHSLTAHAVAAALTKLGYACTLIYNPKKLGFSGLSLVLNDVCVSLLTDLFGDLEIDLLAHHLTSRWVCWVQEKGSERISQPAWVIPYHVLLDRIRQSDPIQSLPIVDENQIDSQELSNNYAWTIYSNVPTETVSIADDFNIFSGGKRVIVTAEITSNPSLLNDSCYIESLTNGWLFYAPLNDGAGILQACLPNLPIEPRRALLNCLYESHLISPLIHHLGLVRCFPAAPRLQFPLYGSRWLMVGESGVKLDPISGEGTPFALRSGILAAAVVDSILQDPTTSDALLNHYQTRLTHSFLSHLQGCSQYYQLVLGNHKLWQGEINQMIDTGQNLSSRLKQQTNSELNYQLIGLKLHYLRQPFQGK